MENIEDINSIRIQENKKISKIKQTVSIMSSYNDCRKQHSVPTCVLAIAAEKIVEKSYNIAGSSVTASGLLLPVPVAIPTVVAGVGISSMGEHAGNKAKNKVLSTSREYNSCLEKNSKLTCATAVAIDNIATGVPLTIYSMLYPIMGREICNKNVSREIGKSAKENFINVVDLAHLTLNTPKGIKANYDELEGFDFLSEFSYDIDSNCFINDKRCIQLFNIDISYLKDILYLFDNDIEDFSMSFEDFRFNGNKAESTNVFYPPIVGSLEIGRVMTEADKTLKGILANNTYTMTTLDDEIRRQFPDSKLNLAGFFSLSNCNIKFNQSCFKYKGHNIKFKAHNYSNNEIDQDINKRRNDAILNFQDVLNNSFDRYKKIYGNSLVQLEELTKAFTVAKLIVQNNCKIIGNKNITILDSLHNTVVSFPTKVRNGTITGGVIVSYSPNLMKKYKTEIGEILRIIPTIDPDLYVDSKDENALVKILSNSLEDSKFKAMINTNKIFVYEIMDKIMNDHLFFDRYLGEFVEELSYSKNDVVEIVMNTNEVETMFNNLPNNRLAERILDNINLNAETMNSFSNIMLSVQPGIKA